MYREDEKWMRRALELARRGMGYVSPNPMVGAVVVRDGQILGEGFHEKYGELHAERNALADCRKRGNDPAGATIYVTLEPCCHYGKTPPCTEAIMENRLGRVVIGSWDPNPLVAGKGAEILREAGLEVDGPVLERECLELNRIFFHYITSKTPYVIMKYAMTADGKIASYTGDARWITGSAARNHTHRTRKKVAAILVGVDTVLADDPMLNCRYVEPAEEAAVSRPPSQEGVSVDPVRIICDTRLRIPMDAAVVKSAGEIQTIIACGMDPESPEMAAKKEALEAAGAEVLPVAVDREGHADLSEIIREMGERRIDSILIEGGGAIHYSALRTGQVNELQAYIAPKIIGGVQAKGPVGGAGIARMADCFVLGTPEVEMIGEDVLITWRKE